MARWNGVRESHFSSCRSGYSPSRILLHVTQTSHRLPCSALYHRCTGHHGVYFGSAHAKSVEREVLDTGTQGSSGGDLVAGFGDLLDSDGQVIGHFDVVTTVNRIMEGADGRFVQAEYSFGPEGADSFIIIGAEQFATDGGLPPVERPATYAVTGGTGIYKGANGQCDVFRNDDPKAFTTTVNCSFSVL